MREDDEHIRQFMPVLRRIIIMVAVLTAIPVAMWTITTFVRTYVGPPKAPDYQPTILTPGVGSDEAVAAPVDSASARAAQNPNAAAPNVVVARATTTDADANPPASDLMSAKPLVTGTTAIPPQAAAPAVVAATPSPAAVVAAQQPAPTNWPTPPPATDDALPAGEPTAGTVPLPRKRPHTFVVAQSNIPLPRPRPDAAGAGAPAPSATPLDWIHSVFRPSSRTAAPQATPEDTDNYVETPH